MKNNTAIAMIVFVVVVGVLAFFGGMKYQQGKNGEGFNRGNFQGVNGVRARGGGQTTGEIISIDDNSITVKLPDGSSKIVLMDNKTTINKASTGTKADLITGERVGVFGTTNTDGSMTAVNIQLNPMLRRATDSGELISK